MKFRALTHEFIGHGMHMLAHKYHMLHSTDVPKMESGIRTSKTGGYTMN